MATVTFSGEDLLALESAEVSPAPDWYLVDTAAAGDDPRAARLLARLLSLHPALDAVADGFPLYQLVLHNATRVQSDAGCIEREARTARAAPARELCDVWRRHTSPAPVFGDIAPGYGEAFAPLDSLLPGARWLALVGDLRIGAALAAASGGESASAAALAGRLTATLQTLDRLRDEGSFLLPLAALHQHDSRRAALSRVLSHLDADPDAYPWAEADSLLAEATSGNGPAPLADAAPALRQLEAEAPELLERARSVSAADRYGATAAKTYNQMPFSSDWLRDDAEERLRMLGLDRESGTCLDAGCADAGLAWHLTHWGWDCDAADLDPRWARAARLAAATAPGPLRYRLIDFRELAGEWDAVVCFSVLQWYEHIDGLLADLAQRAKRVLALELWLTEDDVVSKRADFQTHLRYFVHGRAHLERRLREHGFRIVAHERSPHADRDLLRCERS